MEQAQPIISIEQAKSIAQSVFSEIRAYCTDHPDEFAAFLEHEKNRQRADYIDNKSLNRRSNYGKSR